MKKPPVAGALYFRAIPSFINPRRITMPVKERVKHVIWSDKYSMGIKLIDDQHKGLIGFVNDIFNHVTDNEEEERAWFKEVIQQAVKYVKTHFATEEKFMLATKFPGYAAHKKVHDEFTMTIIKSVMEFEEGKRLVLEKFAYFLKDWVLSHVAVMDRQYSDYFRKIATRKADGKLSITKSDITL
jgi:hemerythrin